MRPTHVTDAIEACIRVNQPVFIWGEPGVGKSSVVKQLGKKLNRNVIDLRLSLLDSVDLRGFPMLQNNRMHFAIPSFLPTDDDADDIIFLDEMNKGTSAVLAAAYQLVLDRALGEYKLPPGCSIVAAGNREHDGADVTAMPAPLANRFTHIDYDVNFDDWRKYANSNQFNPEVVNFINFRPGLLHDFDPEKRAFPTPRSWEFVHTVLNSKADPVIERHLIAGAVGDGAAAEFASFLKIYRNLPDPDAVLMSPKTATVPDDLATLYALCGALAARANEANFGRLIEYCERLKDEFQVMCVRDAVTRQRKLSNTKEFSSWAIKHSSVLI